MNERSEKGSWEERIRAAREAGLSAVDEESARAALRIFENKDNRYGGDVSLCAQDGLIEGAPSTIEPLVEIFRTDQDEQLSGHASIVLGEIAYRQGTEIDRRIIAAAIDRLRGSLATDIVRGEPAIGILRDCAWHNRIPEALPLVEQWLDRVASMPKHDGSFAFRAMEFILAHRGPTYLDRLRKRRDALPASDAFRETLDDYLDLKAKGEVFD